MPQDTPVNWPVPSCKVLRTISPYLQQIAKEDPSLSRGACNLVALEREDTAKGSPEKRAPQPKSESQAGPDAPESGKVFPACARHAVLLLPKPHGLPHPCKNLFFQADIPFWEYLAIHPTSSVLRICPWMIMIKHHY